jgi:hypothetical protein
MRPHDGILILALLALAVAAGCRKDDSAKTSAGPSVQKDPPTASSGPGQGTANGTTARSTAKTPGGAVETPGNASTAAEPTIAAEPTPEESVESLSEAREELNELADGAVSLRAALLGADFRDANAPEGGEAPHEQR